MSTAEEIRDSARRLGLPTPIAYPHHCSRCRAPIFTGNPTGLCSECSPLPCEHCSEPLSITDGLVWVHADDQAIACDVTDDHSTSAIPACSCDREVDPLCRQHGHEDVTSGAYDLSPELRTIVTRILASAVKP